MTVDARKQSEKVLVWLSGLMAGGIFSVQGLLASAPLSMRLAAFLPWTLGVVSAMVSRLLSGELQNRNDGQHFKRVSLLELLQIETDIELIRTNFRGVFEAATAAKEGESKAVYRLLAWTNGAFYFTHVCFVAGVVGAVTTIILAGR